MKRLLPILLALVMVLSLGTSALAADPGSITVENATVGQKYAGYKIFDATWDDAKEKVAYTIEKTSHWFDLANDADSPFELVQVGSSDVYNVLVKDGKTDEDIRNWVLAQPLPVTADLAEVTASTTTVKWTDVDYGYYLVTSTLGALVTVSNVNDDVTIIDKNQWPGWEKPEEPPEDPEDPDQPDKPEGYVPPQAGKNVSPDGYWYSPTSTAALGDTVYFKINSYVPKYNQDKQVYEYIFTDTLDPALSYNGDLAMTLNGTDLVEGTHYKIVVDGQKIKVTIFAYEMGDAYPTDGHLEINFTATVTEEADHINKNEALMDWTQFDPTSPPTDPDDPNGENPPTPADPYDPENPDKPGTTPPPSTTETYVYGFKLQKYAEEVGDETKLEGATFVLYDAETEGNLIPVIKLDDGVYRVATADDAPEAYAEIEAGSATIFGLDTGTYWLEETGAPAGYNPLTERVEIEITRTNVDDDGFVNKIVNVINKSGTILPGTGGIGTKLFYILGSILVLGAVVLLISRKRMANSR